MPMSSVHSGKSSSIRHTWRPSIASQGIQMPQCSMTPSDHNLIWVFLKDNRLLFLFSTSCFGSHKNQGLPAVWLLAFILDGSSAFPRRRFPFAPHSLVHMLVIANVTTLYPLSCSYARLVCMLQASCVVQTVWRRGESRWWSSTRRTSWTWITLCWPGCWILMLSQPCSEYAHSHTHAVSVLHVLLARSVSSYGKMHVHGVASNDGICANSVWSACALTACSDCLYYEACRIGPFYTAQG